MAMLWLSVEGAFKWKQVGTKVEMQKYAWHVLEISGICAWLEQSMRDVDRRHLEVKAVLIAKGTWIQIMS